MKNRLKTTKPNKPIFLALLVKIYLAKRTCALGAGSFQTVEKVAETTRIYKSEHFSLFSTIPK